MASLAAHNRAFRAITEGFHDLNFWIVITCCATISLLLFKRNTLKAFHITVASVILFMILTNFGIRWADLELRNAVNVFDEQRNSVNRNLVTARPTETDTFDMVQIEKTLLNEETEINSLKETSQNKGNADGLRETQNVTTSLGTRTYAFQDVRSTPQMMLNIGNDDKGGNGEYAINEKPSKLVTTIATTRTPVMRNSVIFSRGLSAENSTTNQPDAKQHAPSHSVQAKARNGANKLILFWTRFGKNHTYWWEPAEGYEEGLKVCEYQHCKFTADKLKIKQADVVLFSGQGMKSEHTDWPSYRSPNQLYGHYLNERPAAGHEFLRDFGGKINLTINYRKNADICGPQAELMENKRPTPGPYKLRVPFKNKTRMAVWPVSHCDADSKRQDYIQELSKYIGVDIYGACGNYTCPKESKMACFEEWEKHYKFYLAFENAICEDYITEKYYWTLGYELVPVTLSGERYNSETPPHDAIDAKQFRSPRDLADYLIELANNEEAYTEYFQWKLSYRYHGTGSKTLCNICKTAHTVKYKPAYSDYYGWWFGACDNGLVDRMRQQGGW